MPDESPAPAEAPAALEYQTPPPKWKRFLAALLGGAMVVSSHLLALLASFLILVVLPLLVFVLSYLILFIIATSTNGDMGGLLVLPVGCLLILIIGIPAVMATCLVNVVTDTTRRALRWPFWAVPPIIVFLAFCTVMIINLTHGRETLVLSCRDALLPVAIITAIFCVYWVPLVFGAGVLRVFQWLTKKLWKRFRGDKELIKSTAK